MVKEQIKPRNVNAFHFGVSSLPVITATRTYIHIYTSLQS